MNNQVSPEFPDTDDTAFLLGCPDDEQPGDGSQSKHCLLCCETNVEGATVCDDCGIDLIGDRRDVLARRRNEVMQNIADTERWLSIDERDLYKQTGTEVRANRVFQASRILILIGLLLTPILVGVPVVIAGATIQHVSIKTRKKAERRRSGDSQLIEEDRRILGREYYHLAMIDAAINRLGPA